MPPQRPPGRADRSVSPWRGGACLLAVALAAAAAGCPGPQNRAGDEAARLLERAYAGGGDDPAAADAAPAEEVEANAAPPDAALEVPARVPPPPDPAAPLEVDLRESIRLALLANHDIQIAGYDPLKAREDITKARAAFDPAAYLNNTFGRNDRPIESTLDTGRIADDTLTEDTWALEAGVRQPLGVGGSFSLYESMSYLDTNSTLTIPNPQYRSGLTAEFDMPLLRGFGSLVNLAPIRVACLNEAISMETFRQKVLDTVAQVAAEYWRLVHARAVVSVTGEVRALAREVVRREEVRLDRGLSTPLDVARARSALALREAEHVREAADVEAAVDRLKLLLNTDRARLDEGRGIVPLEGLRLGDAEVDRAEAIAAALGRRPDVAGARRVIDVYRIRTRVAEHERLPRLDAVLRYTMNGLGNDAGASVDMQHLTDPVTWSAGVELEVPLGNRAAEADYRQKRLEYEQALIEADRTVAKALREVNDAVRMVRAARAEAEATAVARMAAEVTVRGEEARYELGQVTNEELLRAQETLAAARKDHLRTRLNYQLARIELGRATATLLEQAGIEIAEADRAACEGEPPVRARLMERPVGP